MADKQSREVVERGTKVKSEKYPDKYWYVTRDDGYGVRVEDKDSVFGSFFPDGTYEIVEELNTIGKSAEESGKKVGQSLANLSVKVDVDCSEALTGLKALTREARKATQAIAELESEVNAHIGIDSIDTVDTFSIKIAEYIADNIPVTFDDMYAILNSINHGRKVGDLRDFTTAELVRELAVRDGVRVYRSSDRVPRIAKTDRILVVEGDK